MVNPSRIEPFGLVTNPATGCLNGCPWCYAEPIAENMNGRYGYPEKPDHFKPTFHEKEIKQILEHKGTGKMVFLVSMGDIFSPGMERDWQYAIFNAIQQRPDNTYWALTKRPDRIPGWLNHMVLPNFYIGVSVTAEKYLWRWNAIKDINAPWGGKWISFEPLRGRIIAPTGPAPDFRKLDWAIIGPQTGNINLIKAEATWLILLTDALKDQGIPVFWKDAFWKQEIISEAAVSAQKQLPKIPKPGQSTLR